VPKTRVNCVKVSGKDAWDPGSQEPASYRGLYICVICNHIFTCLIFVTRLQAHVDIGFVTGPIFRDDCRRLRFFAPSKREQLSWRCRSDIIKSIKRLIADPKVPAKARISRQKCHLRQNSVNCEMS